MKKLIATCALLTSASIVSFAQTNQTEHSMSMQAPANAPARGAVAMTPAQGNVQAEMMADRKCREYQNLLHLTKEQYVGIREAEVAYWKQDMASRANGGQPGPGQTIQNQMGKDQKFKQILSAEQYSKYETTRPDPMAQMRNMK